MGQITIEHKFERGNTVFFMHGVTPSKGKIFRIKVSAKITSDFLLGNDKIKRFIQYDIDKGNRITVKDIHEEHLFASSDALTESIKKKLK